jgi:hypothetical protein
MDQAWHGCWPAVTIVPSFLVTGVLAVLISLAVIVWAAFFVSRKHGGLILMLVSMLMLPVGGGIIPVVLGIVAGAVGTRINTPLTWWRNRLSGRASHLLARLWPWPLIAYFAWVPIQWLLGHFYNDFMLQQGFLFMLVDYCLLLVSIVTGFAYDIEETSGGEE